MTQLRTPKAFHDVGESDPQAKVVLLLNTRGMSPYSSPLIPMQVLSMLRGAATKNADILASLLLYNCCL